MGGVTTLIGKSNFSDAATISYNQTIGDYTQPASAVGTSEGANSTPDNEYDMSTDPWTKNDSGAVVVSGGVTTLALKNDGTNDAAVIDLGAGNVSNSGFVLDFDYKVSEANASKIIWFGLSDSDETVSASTAQDLIAFRMDVSPATVFGGVTTNGATPISSNVDGNEVAVLPIGTQYYMRITRISTTSYKVERFTDSARTILDHSAAGTCSASCSGLRYIKFMNRITTVSNDDEVIIDNIKFYNNGLTLLATNAVNDDLTNRWESDSETNPAIYVDCAAAKNILALAVYVHANTTETQVKIRGSTDTTFSDGENLRTITVTGLTAGAWNYIRVNLVKIRYLQIYGSSGTSLVLAISDIKYLTKTDSEILQDLSIVEISPTNTSLGLDGV